MTDEQWYWVTDGASVWPAYRSDRGIWTNGDTWEDFRGVVIACEKIAPPSVLHNEVRE